MARLKYGIPAALFVYSVAAKIEHLERFQGSGGRILMAFDWFR
jgi:hypothetical protein